MEHAKWKLWNGYGPLPGRQNEYMAVERIGPEHRPGEDSDLYSLVGAQGYDIIGTRETLEFVVLAVNSHDALLAGCEVAQDAIHNLHCVQANLAHLHSPLCSRLRAATAKARPE